MPSSTITTGDIGIAYQGLDITKQVLTSNGSFQSRSTRNINDKISETLKSKNSLKTQKNRHELQKSLQNHRISILKNHSLNTAKDVAREADKTTFESNHCGKLSFKRCERLKDSITKILSIPETFKKEIDEKDPQIKKIQPIVNVKKFQENILQNDLTLFLEKVIKASKTVSGLESIRVELAFLNQEDNLTKKQYKHLHKLMAAQYNESLTEILEQPPAEGYQEHLERLKELHALTTSLSAFDKRLLKQWHESLKQKSLMHFAHCTNSLKPSQNNLATTIQQQTAIETNKEEYLRPILEQTSKHPEKRLTQADISTRKTRESHQYAIDRPYELLKAMDRENSSAAVLQNQVFHMTQKALVQEQNLDAELNHYKELKRVATRKFLGRIGPKYLSARLESRTSQKKLINQIITTHKELKDIQDRYDQASTLHADRVNELRELYHHYGSTITTNNGNKTLFSHHLNRLDENCDLEIANNCLKLWTQNRSSDVAGEAQGLLVDLIQSGEYSPQRALTLFGTAFLSQTPNTTLGSRIEALKTRKAENQRVLGKKSPCINFAPLSQQTIESGNSYADYLIKRLSGSPPTSQPALGQPTRMQQRGFSAPSTDTVRPSEPLYYSEPTGAALSDPTMNKLLRREDFSDADRKRLLRDIQQSNLPEESKTEFASYVSDSALQTNKGNRYSFETIHKATRKTLNDFDEGHSDIWSSFNNYLVTIAQVPDIDETPLDALSRPTPQATTPMADLITATPDRVISDQQRYKPEEKVTSGSAIPFPPPPPPPA
ncbi:hypothetical protein, partial [Candidatus Sororendozoicomonas aggregata]|uniref:hypothetical protein n=1 Tax=Candidatus Sororendozoicomonas aggregata TaxID=3073239 RepID=UPI002ED0D4A9